jgi:hypothetical protein
MGGPVWEVGNARQLRVHAHAGLKEREGKESEARNTEHGASEHRTMNIEAK